MNDEPDPPHSLSSRFRYSHLYSPSLSRSFIEHPAFVDVYVCLYARRRCGCVGAGLPAPERQAARRAPSLERVSPRSTDEDDVCRRRSSASRSGTDKINGRERGLAVDKRSAEK